MEYFKMCKRTSFFLRIHFIFVRLLCRIKVNRNNMFQQKIKNPPTTSKLGVRPGNFKFTLGSAVLVVGFLIFSKNAEPRENYTRAVHKNMD